MPPNSSNSFLLQLTTQLGDFPGHPITCAIQHEMVPSDNITHMNSHMNVLFETYVAHITGAGVGLAWIA